MGTRRELKCAKCKAIFLHPSAETPLCFVHRGKVYAHIIPEEEIVDGKVVTLYYRCACCGARYRKKGSDQR